MMDIYDQSQNNNAELRLSSVHEHSHDSTKHTDIWHNG